MEKQKSMIEKYINYYLLIIFAVGFIGHIIPVFSLLMARLTPYVLLLNAVIIVYILKLNIKEFYFIVYVFIFTLIIEIIGVKTSLIFGNYSYGEVLGIKVAGVPLIIGINWTLIIISSILLSNNVVIKVKYFYNLSERKKTEYIYYFIVALLAGLIAVIFDLFLEPVAVKLNYWYWEFSIIPLKNYISWFVITFFVSLVYLYLKLKIKSNLLVLYLIIQLSFFVLLNLFL